jgi:hypothetical protein
VWHPQRKRTEVRLLHKGGRAEARHTAQRLRHLARSILQQGDPQEMVQHAVQGRLGDAGPSGPLYVLEALWQRLGIADSSAEPRTGRKRDGPGERALCAMVATRAWAPWAQLDG